MPGIGIGRSIPRHKSRVWGGQTNPSADLKELALFDITQQKSAATMFRVYNTGTSSSFDVPPLPGMPKPKDYNYIQSSNGKFGVYGIKGINNTAINMSDGILTLTASGGSTIIGIEFYPVVRAVKNTRLFIRSYTRLVAGNIPTASYVQFQNTAGSRDVIYNVMGGNPHDWSKHIAVHTITANIADKKHLAKAVLEIEYGTIANVQGAIVQIDMRVGIINGIDYSNGPVGINMGTNDTNPLYNLTADQMDAKYPNYILPFGFDTGEADGATVVENVGEYGNLGYLLSWTDQTGNGYTTIPSTVVDNLPLICKNQTFYFAPTYDGNDYLTANGSILLNQSEFTIVTRFIPMGTSNVQVIFQQGDQCSITIGENMLTFKVGNDYAYANIGSNNIVGITAKKTKTDIKIYMNGNNSPVWSAAASEFTITDTSNTVIGDGLNGQLMVLKFYGSALPAKLAGKLSSGNIVVDTGIQKTYALDEIQGAVTAMSMCKLKTTQKKAFRVRRQDNGEESDVGFIGSQIDAESMIDFAGYSTLEIIRGYDSSGNGFDWNNNINQYPNLALGKSFLPGSTGIYIMNDTTSNTYFASKNPSLVSVSAQNSGSYTIRMSNVIPGNGRYSIEFWINGISTPITVDICDVPAITVYPSEGSEWKHIKVEDFAITNYSSSVYNFIDIQFSVPPQATIRFSGFSVYRAKSITNKPICVKNGRLLSGIIFDGSQAASTTSNYGDHMTTATKKCRARYIRDWINGSTANNSNHWVELLVIGSDGCSNLGYGRIPISNLPFNNAANLTNQDISTGNLLDYSNGGLQYVQLDLGSVQDISQIVVWHYWADGRTYHNTKTEISDGSTWTTLFDSAISGEYIETEAGHFIFDEKLHNLKSFSVYLGFVKDKLNSAQYCRIAGKGEGEKGAVGGYPIKRGFGINTWSGGDDGNTGDLRFDTLNNSNKLLRIKNVWDTGHNLMYLVDGSGVNPVVQIYKDWQLLKTEDLSTINSGTTIANDKATFNVGGETYVNPFPWILCGSTDQMAGSIRSFVVFDHVLTSEEIEKLSKCTL